MKCLELDYLTRAGTTNYKVKVRVYLVYIVLCKKNNVLILIGCYKELQFICNWLGINLVHDTRLGTETPLDISLHIPFIVECHWLVCKVNTNAFIKDQFVVMPRTADKIIVKLYHNNKENY